jgi:type II secretory pathway pseudopilin PulG
MSAVIHITTLQTCSSAARATADNGAMSSNMEVTPALGWRSKRVSLIEPVVVVTLLGLLCSFAIPRFTHVQNVVRASEVVALSVNLRSAAAVAHAQYLEPGARLSSAILKGRNIELQNGYPDAGPNGIRMAVANLSNFTVSFTPTSVTYSKTDAPDPVQCAVTYHASPAASSEATVTGLETSGC